MYYEERVIDGILHSRGSPDAAFEPMGQRQLTALILREREEHKAKVLRMELSHHDDLGAAATEGKWQERQGDEYGAF